MYLALTSKSPLDFNSPRRQNKQTKTLQGCRRLWADTGIKKDSNDIQEFISYNLTFPRQKADEVLVFKSISLSFKSLKEKETLSGN